MRVLLNSYMSWTACSDTCQKYREAKSISFKDKAGMEKIISWANNASIDPHTQTPYPDVKSMGIWLPFR